MKDKVDMTFGHMYGYANATKDWDIAGQVTSYDFALDHDIYKYADPPASSSYA